MTKNDLYPIIAVDKDMRGIETNRVYSIFEFFDHLEPWDQVAFAKMPETFILQKGSIIIGGLVSENPGEIEPGA